METKIMIKLEKNPIPHEFRELDLRWHSIYALDWEDKGISQGWADG